MPVAVVTGKLNGKFLSRYEYRYSEVQAANAGKSLCAGAIANAKVHLFQDGLATPTQWADLEFEVSYRDTE